MCDCDFPCIMNIISVFLVFGAIANALVFVIILTQKTLHDATFIVIGGLAVSDAVLISIIVVQSLFHGISIAYCLHPAPDTRTRMSHATIIVGVLAWFSSSLHVLLLSVIRYSLLVHPFSASQYLTARRATLMSVSVWLFSILLSVGTFSLTFFVDSFGRVFYDVVLVLFNVLAYIIPVLVTSVLHSYKLFYLWKSSRASGPVIPHNAPAITSSMSKMVAVVIAIFILFPLPHVIFNLLSLNRNINQFSPSMKIFRALGHLFFSLNSFVNPFVYAYMSKMFRKSLCQFVLGKRLRRRDSLEGNNNAPMMGRQRGLSVTCTTSI